MAENWDPHQIELDKTQIRFNNSMSSIPISRIWLEVGDIMSEDVTTVEPGHSVVSTAEIMSHKNISCIVVSDNGHLSGIITETDLLKRAVAGGNDFRKMTVEQIMSSRIHTVSRNLSILEASKIMEAENIRRLVVLEDKRLVGVITQTDIIRVLTSYGIWKDISEIMTSDVAVIGSSVRVKEAAEVMDSQDISCLIAMDNNTVTGIFTERDLLTRVIALKRNPAQIILKKVMSSPVVTIPSHNSVLSATKTMEKKKIRRLVVMDGGILRGVVTQTDILKATKEKFQEDEENYFMLLNESHNCIYIVDLNNNTIFVNPALMRMLDVTDPDELINKPFLPERFWDNPNQRSQILGQLKKASVEVNDLTLRTTKGKKLFITLFSTRTKNIKGQTSGSQGVLYDITAKKELATLREMEQQLRSSRDLLRGTLESTADGILVVDEQGRFSHMNNRFVKIWDIPEDILKRRDDKGLFKHLDCRLDSSSAFLEKLQASSPDNQDSSDVLYLNEGTVLEVYSLPLIREGRFAGRVWSFSDITKRTQAEEALKQAKDRAELIYKVVPSAIFTVDANKCIRSCNNKAAEITGYTAEEVIGEKCTVFAYEPCGHKCGLYADDVEKPVIGKECTIKRKDGQIRTISKNVDFLKNANGRIIGGIESFEDITERKKAEEKQARLLEQVENANRELKDFASIVSHDLKAPLRGVKALANWILSDYADKLGNEANEQMNLLLERVEKMHDLIEGVLQYSRAGRAEGKRVQINLNDIVPEFIHMVVPPENIKVTIENELPVIECEEIHVMQVFQNLLSNAIKYMDKPQGQIHISCVEQDGFWKFSIADNGPGIEEKHFERIFKIFQALPTSPDFQGTGVGLSVVKKIVELYNGRIWIESKVGEGSTFCFTLPKWEIQIMDTQLEANIAR
jgi:PAS domain S-box-containing protein